MEVALVAVVIGALVMAVVVMVVLYRAISNVFDWVVATFGNDGPTTRSGAPQDPERHADARALDEHERSPDKNRRGDP